MARTKAALVVAALLCLFWSWASYGQDLDEICHRGMKHAEEGRDDEALADFNRVLAVDSDHIEARFARGYVWSKKKKYDKAIADYDEVIKRVPENAEVRCNRGRVWQLKGDYDKAFADYRDALQLNPRDPIVRNNMAWVQSTCPVEKYRNGASALENARRALQLRGDDDWRLAGTMAAAYAETGEFDKARQWQEKAIAFVKEDKTATPEDRVAMRSRLEVYKAKKPYRETAPVK